MIKPLQLALSAFDRGLSGKAADTVVRSYAPSVPKPYRAIELRFGSIDELERMLPEANELYLSIERKVVFSALYQPECDCPYYRMYSYGAEIGPEADAVYRRLQNRGFVFPYVERLDLQRLLETGTSQEAIEQFRQRAEVGTAPYSTVFRGRTDAGIVDKGIMLNSDSCLTCNNPYNRLMTASLGSDVMVGFYLCEQCEQEAAAKPSLFHFLAEKFGYEWRFQARPLSREEIFEMGERVLQYELRCTTRSYPERFQITGIRESGFKVIFRLEGMLDYGYMIMNPSGDHVARFDASKDHRKEKVQPDHEHYSLPNDNSKVRPSYLTGIPAVDVPRIRTRLEELEGEHRRT